MTGSRTETVFTVAAADGIPLVYQVVHASKPVALLAHIPGLGTNRRYMLPLAEQLAEQGITTCALDMRGHGESGGERGDVPHYLAFASDVRQVLDDIRSRLPGLPLFLSGLSMGGLVALITAMAYPERIQGLIGMAPVLVDRYLPFSWKAEMIGRGAASGVLPELGDQHYPTALGLGIKVTSNPAGEALMREDPFRQDRVTARLYWQLLQMNLYLMRHPRQLRNSLLLLLAGDDRVGWNWASRHFFSSVGVADKTLREYPDCCHDLTLEVHERAIAADLAAWIQARL